MLDGSKARWKVPLPLVYVVIQQVKKHLDSHLHPFFLFAPPPISSVPPHSFFVILSFVFSSPFSLAVPS